MPTSKPLKSLIPQILKHVERHTETLQYNLRKYRSYEGQIKKEIEISMRSETLSDAAYTRAKQRIPSINIIKKTVDKLSKVYAEPVTRMTKSKQDQMIMDSIIEVSGFDSVMMGTNKMVNLSKMAAIEPYTQNGEQRFRVLGGHQFLPFSDNIMNPLEMTVLIKLLGSTDKKANDYRDYITSDGLLVTDEDEMRTVDLFQLFSDNEIIIIDSDGSIRLDMMAKYGLNGTNPLNIIPHIYINASKFELVPFPDTSDLDISILVPKILADTNYAIQYMSHSILWTKNVEMGNQEIHPDVVLDLGDRSPDGGDPDIGLITPKIDIMGTLSLIEFELSSYFSSKGIKTTGMKENIGKEASGIAKAIDEGDVSAELKAQKEFFRSIERSFWKKMEIIQNTWSDLNMVSDNRKFSPKFSTDYHMIYKDLQVIESTQEKVMKIQAQKDLGVIDRRSILKEFNPDMSEEQIDKRLEVVDDEKDKEMDQFNMGALLNEQSTTEEEDQDTEEPK